MEFKIGDKIQHGSESGVIVAVLFEDSTDGVKQTRYQYKCDSGGCTAHFVKAHQIKLIKRSRQGHPLTNMFKIGNINEEIYNSKLNNNNNNNKEFEFKFAENDDCDGEYDDVSWADDSVF